MPNNSTVKAQRQSLRNIHYALLTSDTPEGVTYAKPEPLVGAISASISPTTNQEKLWADDGVFDIASQLGDITLELELAALPMKAQAILPFTRFSPRRRRSFPGWPYLRQTGNTPVLQMTSRWRKRSPSASTSMPVRICSIRSMQPCTALCAGMATSDTGRCRTITCRIWTST